MKQLSRAEEKDVMAAVREVYQELARRPVVRHCARITECCQFRLTGEMPTLTLGEALVAARAYRATGRKVLPKTEDCPLFDAAAKKCLIYESRPFGCRTHFCEAAGGSYERREVVDLIRKLEDIDMAFVQAGKCGARLPYAVKMFL